MNVTAFLANAARRVCCTICEAPGWRKAEDLHPCTAWLRTESGKQFICGGEVRELSADEPNPVGTHSHRKHGQRVHFEYKSVSREAKREFEAMVCRLAAETTHSHAALEHGVPISTVGVWMAKHGLEKRRTRKLAQQLDRPRRRCRCGRIHANAQCACGRMWEDA